MIAPTRGDREGRMRFGGLFGRGKSGGSGARSFVLRSYARADGSFDYELYRSQQEEGNKLKLGNCWALAENIEFLSDYLRRRLGNMQFGICHGTRRGLEQQWFREHLNCEVIGTEISETATQFANTIRWDFHDVKPEWLGKADFVYSNSFDHSHDPARCITRWMNCLRPGGVCIIEHTTAHEPDAATHCDPFGAALTIMPYLILDWGKGAFAVQEILAAPKSDRKSITSNSWSSAPGLSDQLGGYERSRQPPRPCSAGGDIVIADGVRLFDGGRCGFRRRRSATKKSPFAIPVRRDATLDRRTLCSTRSCGLVFCLCIGFIRKLRMLFGPIH
jgi:hypothetical protein